MKQTSELNKHEVIHHCNIFLNCQKRIYNISIDISFYIISLKRPLKLGSKNYNFTLVTAQCFIKRVNCERALPCQHRVLLYHKGLKCTCHVSNRKGFPDLESEAAANCVRLLPEVNQRNSFIYVCN